MQKENKDKKRNFNKKGFEKSNDKKAYGQKKNFKGKEPYPKKQKERGDVKDKENNRKSFERKQIYRKPIDRKEIEKEEKNYDDQVEGRNSVLELLESGKDINKLFIAKGEKHGSINKIIALAKEKRVIIVEKDRRQLEEMAGSENCQGVIAVVPPFEYSEVEEILEYAKSKNEDPFILILDGIEDPHNLGSIIRTAETAGVHGVIIPKRRAASVNSTVNKVSAGAVQYMRVARVTNISDIIEDLKQAGLWICGTDLNTDKYYYNQDLTGPLAIVIGNEGNGIGEKVRKNCDFLVKIPMLGKVDSLNASVGTGVVVFEAVKQRKK